MRGRDVRRPRRRAGCAPGRDDAHRPPATILRGPAWFSARRSAVTWSGSGSPMPIGTEDDLSSRHCRHSTTHGPSGRWIILGWCTLRTPTSCSSNNAPSPSGTLAIARQRPQKGLAPGCPDNRQTARADDGRPTPRPARSPYRPRIVGGLETLSGRQVRERLGNRARQLEGAPDGHAKCSDAVRSDDGVRRDHGRVLRTRRLPRPRSDLSLGLGDLSRLPLPACSG